MAVRRTASYSAKLAAPAVGSIPRQYGGDSCRAQHLAGPIAVRSTAVLGRKNAKLKAPHAYIHQEPKTQKGHDE